MNAGLNHTGGSMFDNIAFSNPISEVTDSALTSYFDGVEIYWNILMTKEELIIESIWCLNLCFIGQEYLKFFADNYDALFEL